MSKHFVAVVALVAAFVFSETPLYAAEKPAKRPKIAVVLEGGGAKGFAHVGVLKVLEEQHVPIDIVVGTSMGSIVGAAYASGRTIPEMEQALSTTDWDALFNETPPRREVHYRLKAGKESELYGDTKIGIKDGEAVTPLALVQGQNVEPTLQRLFGKVPASVNFDTLPVPFRAVAADIETGDAVIIDHGSLSTAARASMSVPGFFTPVEFEGRTLVDGGVTDNLPIDVALAMGADVIIAVECKDHLRTRDKLKGPLAISGQVIDLLLERNTRNALKLLRSQDIHVEVEVGDYSATSFADASKIMELGERDARLQINKFAKYSMPPEQYAAYAERRSGGAEFTPVIDYVRIEKTIGYEGTELKKTFEKGVGKPLDRKKIEEELTALSRSGDFQKVTYDIEEKDGKQGLVINAEPKEWLKNFARVGFSLQDNFDGDNNYNLAIQTRLNDINSLGGFLDVQLAAGQLPQAIVELYQPVAEGSRFFVAPLVSVGKRQLSVRDDDTVIAEYQRYEQFGELKGGYSLGKYGEFSTGWRRGSGDVNRQIGEPTLNNFDYDIGEAFAKFALDQFDNPDFPTEGYRLNLTGSSSREGLGASDDYERAVAAGSVPFTYGANTLLLNAEAGFASNDLPIERYASLGGFFDLSGFAQSSLTASDYWIYRAALYRRVAKGGSALFPFGGYFGGTMEVATLRSGFEGINDMTGLVGGSVFIGADTPVLPVYFGYGLNDEHDHSFYMNIGRIAGRRR